MLVFPAVLRLPGPHRFSFEVITTAAAAAALVGVPLLLQAAGRRCWRALDNPFTRWLGTRSYSIYLYHFVVFAQFAAWVGGPLGYREHSCSMCWPGSRSYFSSLSSPTDW